MGKLAPRASERLRGSQVLRSQARASSSSGHPCPGPAGLLPALLGRCPLSQDLSGALKSWDSPRCSLSNENSGEVWKASSPLFTKQAFNYQKLLCSHSGMHKRKEGVIVTLCLVRKLKLSQEGRAGSQMAWGTKWPSVSRFPLRLISLGADLLEAGLPRPGPGSLCGACMYLF